MNRSRYHVQQNGDRISHTLEICVVGLNSPWPGAAMTTRLWFTRSDAKERGMRDETAPEYPSCPGRMPHPSSPASAMHANPHFACVGTPKRAV